MKMIDPAGIPQFTGNFEQLDKAVSGLRSDAIGIRNGGGDVHSRFQMLGAYYTAPEADDLFASTQPVMDRADTFAADLETVADALDTFSIEARPLAKRLEQLKADAIAFVDSVEGDDEWTYDGDKIDRHHELMTGVAETESAFREAERRAATTISAIVGGPKFIEDDGSHKSTSKTVMYGYDAELLKQAKETPWGSPVSESYHAWEIHQHVKHFVWDGFVIDGGLHALQGLGHLFGIGGSAKDAWGNLKDVVSGIGQYTMTPYDWVMDHTIGPDEENADEQRQKKAAGEFAKSLVAWDQWEENPVQAAGTTTFNFLTLGAGPLGVVAKGSKPGAGAKAAGIGAKIGTYADPLSAGLTVGGKAISKLPTVAELTAQIRTGAHATADVQRVHSVIELDGGFKARVEDGEFTRIDAEGNRINETAPPEKSAAERTAPEEAPSQREPALVGAGPRAPEAAAHAGENLPPQAGHTSPGGKTADSLSGAARSDAPSATGAGHAAGSGEARLGNSDQAASTPRGDGAGPNAGDSPPPPHADSGRGDGEGDPERTDSADESEPPTGHRDDPADTTQSGAADTSSTGASGNAPDFSRPALLPADGPLTLDQVRRTRDWDRRWRSGEEFHRQMYGGGAERPYPVPTSRDPQYPVTKAGGRKVDVPVDMPDGRTLAVEVKTYLEYRTITLHDGTKQTVKGEVPLSKHIKEEIHKDIALRNMDPRFDPRWSFTHAGPSPALRAYLQEARIIFLEYGPTPPKK
ncbi:hypothetical protein [Streptomyces yerevanensis]|uniref:hypothetical protein n=1 Tax=Streptomyces yerevanensis TaxID=66378 RepID=UPI00068E6F01|nr:hypothetical protein [Streptomyces yerevanensis]